MYTIEKIRRHAYILLLISRSDMIDPIGSLRFNYDELEEVEKWENLIKKNLNDLPKE